MPEPHVRARSSGMAYVNSVPAAPVDHYLVTALLASEQDRSVHKPRKFYEADGPLACDTKRAVEGALHAATRAHGSPVVSLLYGRVDAGSNSLHRHSSRRCFRARAIVAFWGFAPV